MIISFEAHHKKAFTATQSKLSEYIGQANRAKAHSVLKGSNYPPGGGKLMLNQSAAIGPYNGNGQLTVQQHQYNNNSSGFASEK